MFQDGRGVGQPTVGVRSSRTEPPLSPEELRALESAVTDVGGVLRNPDGTEDFDGTDDFDETGRSDGTDGFDSVGHFDATDEADGRINGLDLVVAIGDEALSASVSSGSEVPILPVSVDHAIEQVTRSNLAPGLEAVLAGDGVVRRHPVLTARIGDEQPRRGLFDVTLTAAEPAHISEYAVTSRSERIARFRADGVVVATPIGTRGYAGSVSAPELSPAINALAVSPIAPFVMHANHWVLPDDDLSVSVERDEVPISVSVDGRDFTTIGTELPVTIGVEASVPTVSVAATQDDEGS